ncbi:hypothetical protein AALP_AA6G053200 [Arabis alpina]|uniref:Protein kinase domain-containing protein n=1 Tax=Arabis alpina TaxID=50452 RepID=A0A087GM78_ARAAL|nr:hypothetical protein AALP_AA6G053200 [Arabis alpina]
MDFLVSVIHRGSVLGKPLDEFEKLYKLDNTQLLGVGGSGKTYICKEISTDKCYACKSIPKGQLGTKERKQLVRTEIRIMKLFSGDSNIVQIKGSYEDENDVHIVMELCSGGELFDKILDVVKSGGYYTEKDMAKIFKSIMEAIQVIHSANVIHGDVRPENFLFSSEDDKIAKLKAIDFGSSLYIRDGIDLKVLAQKKQEMKDPDKSKNYVAPEVLRKESYGEKIDIWSAGVILYLLLSGEPPFVTDYEIMERKLDFSNHPWPSISPAAKDLIKKMLQKVPEKRCTALDVLTHSWIKSKT